MAPALRQKVKKNLNLRRQTKPLMAGADAKVYCPAFAYIIWPSNQTYTVASAQSVTGSVFIRRFPLFWALIPSDFIILYICIMQYGLYTG